MSRRGAPSVHLLAGRPGAGGPDRAVAAALAACGRSGPLVACVGAANGDNPMFFARMKSALRAVGAGEVLPVKLAAKKSDLGEAKAIMERADVVFMGGGDVEAGMRTLADRDVVDWLRGLHAAGKPFLGISAGSIMLCRDWVRWRDPDDDATAEAFPCLGFAPVRCDTHAEKEGFEELSALLRLLDDGAVGYGIPSGAGLEVSSGGGVAALGRAVWIFAKRSGGVIRLPDLTVEHGIGR